MTRSSGHKGRKERQSGEMLRLSKLPVRVIYHGFRHTRMRIREFFIFLSGLGHLELSCPEHRLFLCFPHARMGVRPRHLFEFGIQIHWEEMEPVTGVEVGKTLKLVKLNTEKC